MSLKTDLHTFQNNMFDLIMFITYLLIFISAIGFSESAPKYLNNLDYYIRVYICLFLIWRFNPLRKTYEFTDLDRKITFNAGCLILTTTALNQYLLYFKKTVEKIIF